MSHRNAPRRSSLFSPYFNDSKHIPRNESSKKFRNDHFPENLPWTNLARVLVQNSGPTKIFQEMHLPVLVLALCFTPYEALLPKQIPEDESQKSFRKNDFQENIIFRLTTRGNNLLASS